MAGDEQDQMTAAAIARWAGVGRAAVSNWRRRYPGFPQPVGGSAASPMFSRREVETWLKSTGKADQLATAGRTDTGTQRLDESEALLLSWTGAAPITDEFEQPVSDLTPGKLLARVVAALLPRSTGAADHVESDTEVPVVLDPACSKATMLLAVADRFGRGVTLAGQEIDEDTAAAAGVNLRTDPRDLRYDNVRTGDSLRDNHLDAYLGRAAAVVCEPPFDQPQWPSVELTTDPRWEFGIPAPRDSELAWVQHCYAHLRPRGVAVVAVTPRTCVQPSGERIRAALVRSGVLRDVIALPAGMSSLPETDVYLWVLQRPYGDPDPAVRMVDLSNLGDPADVPSEFAAWERLLYSSDPTVIRAVPRLEVLGTDADLLPSRYVSSRTEASANDLAAITARLEALYERIGQGLPRFDAPRTRPRYSYLTLGELERAGALRIQPRDVTPRPGDLLIRTLGRPPVVATGTAADDTGIAQIIEIDQTRLDVNFVATFLRADANALPVANTLGALSRDDLRRCRVPRLTLADQRRYGDAFRGLLELQDALTSLTAVSTNVIGQTIHGLTTGALAPDIRPSTTPDDGETL